MEHISRAQAELISAIISKGNTAEVKKVKEGVLILEVDKKIRYRDKPN